MPKPPSLAMLLLAGTLVPEPQAARPPMVAGLRRPPVVTATESPAEAEALPVKWLKVADPDLGAMRAAVARPPGTGSSYPAVLILHGTHGFGRQYVERASDLARSGFIVVAACWFSGGGGAGANVVTPIPCPEIPPLGPGDYPEGVQFVDALVQATRPLPWRSCRSTGARRAFPRRRCVAAVPLGRRGCAGVRSSLVGLHAPALATRRLIQRADPDHAWHRR